MVNTSAGGGRAKVSGMACRHHCGEQGRSMKRGSGSTLPLEVGREEGRRGSAGQPAGDGGEDFGIQVARL